MSKNIKIYNLIMKLSISNDDKKVLLNYIEELENRDEKLSALEAGGVDNWEWYAESLSDYFNNIEEEEEEED